MEGIQHLIKTLTSIIKDPGNETAIGNLHECIKLAQPEILNNIQPHIYSTYNVIFKYSLKEKCYKEDTKQTVTDSICTLLGKIKIDNVEMFFFLYGFLLNEVYDDNEPTMVKKIHEEYKLSIMRCMKAIMEALSWDILLELYTRKHAPKLCQMLYVALEMAKREQLRTLRISSIECIMAIAQVLDLSSEADLELRNQVADVFMFFIPGISTGLKDIALEDEKSGHMVCLMALRAWGRVVALQMQNYDSSADQNVPDTLAYHISSCSIKEESEDVSGRKNKWKNNEEVKEYIENSKRTLQWYKETDAKIQPMVKSLSRLTCHSHTAVRLELTDVCSMLIKHCSTSIPLSVSQVVEILVTLSEDDDKELSVKARKIITDFSKGCFTDLLKVVGENIQENFYNTILALPRIMNSIDDNQQLSGLNLLLGYLRLFGSTHLSQVLHSTSRLNHLISAIIQICELDNGDVRILEDYVIKDFELEPDCRTPWKKFRYFPNETVAKKIEEICTFLGESGTLTLISGVLQDYFVNDEDHRREVTLILNNVLKGCKTSEHINIVRDVINMYLDPEHWNLPLEVSTNEYGEKYTLPEIQNNVIQICLQLEGIGRIALVIGKEFEQFLIKSLYPVLEQAGSGNSLVRTAGLAAITNISVACNYQSVTELVNSNADYFSFHVVRKIHRAEHNKSVLNVLAVVMNYSTIDVLESMADIVSGVLLQSCDKFFQDRNANTFLRVFKVFISCLIRWLNIEIVVQPIIPKEQRRIQHFEVSGINHDQDFSDAVMGDKTAEEMFKEDMEKGTYDKDESSEIDEVDEYKTPEPPMHVKLTVSILRRCQHFLPSKNRDRKILVLEILKSGFEVIRSWDNELLPLVHQVWSPLVNRFTEFNEPLIINCSFQLLVTMARVSKDFICSRTTKEVLPHIVTVLTTLSRESFLKDKGAAYRYTQSYKLQLTIINNLAAVISDLEMSEKHITECLKAVAPYLNNKQPVPLQEAAVNFFVDLGKYDKNLVSTAIKSIENDEKCSVISASERVNCKRNIEKIMELCTTV